MSELLYAKYNSIRKPQYQLATFIRQDGDRKFVVKHPIVPKAKYQMDAIKANFKTVEGLYKNIMPIPYEESGEDIIFKFVKGTPVLEPIDAASEEMDSIVDKLKNAIDVIYSYKEEYISKFEMTDDFANVFGKEGTEALVGKDAVRISNFDSIYDNFISVEDKIYCIDYEWVFEFPIPMDFLKYRTLKYYYEDEVHQYSARIERDEFLKLFGFSEEDIKLYDGMEYGFQEYVFGENVRYNYPEKYKRSEIVVDKYIEDTTQLIHEKDAHIENLNENISVLNTHISNFQTIVKQNDEYISSLRTNLDDLENHVEELNVNILHLNEGIIERDSQIINLSTKMSKIKRSILNPFYGIYLLCKIGPKKIKGRYEHKKQMREEQKHAELIEKGIEKTRYQELLEETDGVYEPWIESLEAEYDHSAKFDYNPMISVVVPVYNVEDRHLIPCIESVRNQYYKNWELILVDDNSTYENVRKTLNKYRWKSLKIRVKYRKENGRISECTNTGLEMVRGEYVAFMDCDDTLAPFTLYEVVKKLNEDREIDFVYSDEDKIDDDGKNRQSPFFKPDWSPDTLMSYMYTSHLGVYKTDIIREIGGCRKEFDGCQDYDLTLRFTEKSSKVGHVPKVLYHWRQRQESTASNPEAKEYVKDATRKCKEEALARRGLHGKLEWISDIYQYRVKYIPSGDSLVSVIIPSKDNPGILRQCISSFVEKTDYKKVEFVVVDNGSNDENRAEYEKLSKEYGFKYIYEKKDFNFSYMCNLGAANANGDYLLFLNDDIEIISDEWLERMLGQAELPHVGAVGAKLLYPDTTLIQHAGVINIESGPVHEFAKMDDEDSYYFNRNKLDFDCLAVTAACLLLKTSKFNEIGGFEEDLAVAYNDIDLCFKLIEKGYFNVIRNDAVLYHHESLSRGDDNMDKAKFRRLMDEQNKLYDRHPQFRGYDPYYNENLSQIDCDFRYNYDKQKTYDLEEIADISQYHEDEKLMGGIDIRIASWCIYIEGWAIEHRSQDNMNMYVDLLLKKEGRAYKVSTSKVHRKDVAETFKDETDVEFAGFRTRIPRDLIEDGEYEICILYKDMILDTEVTIDK
ncbi:MAG: glycosyltransferase [Eubacterium sp.]|nr:glycosyltransferase [Eubacterium sp.]